MRLCWRLRAGGVGGRGWVVVVEREQTKFATYNGHLKVLP
jgi:hypothetical protein